MRTTALLTAALLLAAQVGLAAQEARPQSSTMIPSEDAHLARRAAQSPHLERFAARGNANTSIEAFVYTIVFMAEIAVANLIGFPLGLSHSTGGKGFVPKEATSNQIYVFAMVAGFPMYSLGYVLGLPCAPREKPEIHPKPKESTER